MKKAAQLSGFWRFCDSAGIRTQDPYIKSVLLYQLSYGIDLYVSGAFSDSLKLLGLHEKLTFWLFFVSICLPQRRIVVQKYNWDFIKQILRVLFFELKCRKFRNWLRFRNLNV